MTQATHPRTRAGTPGHRTPAFFLLLFRRRSPSDAAHGVEVDHADLATLAVARLLYAAMTNDPVSPLPPAAWITLAVIPLSVGRAREPHA